MRAPKECAWIHCALIAHSGDRFCAEHTTYVLSPAGQLDEVIGLGTLKEWILEHLLDDDGNVK